MPIKPIPEIVTRKAQPMKAKLNQSPPIIDTELIEAELCRKDYYVKLKNKVE